MKKYNSGDIVYCKQTRDDHVIKNKIYKVEFVNSRIISIFGENDRLLYYKHSIDELENRKDYFMFDDFFYSDQELRQLKLEKLENG